MSDFNLAYPKGWDYDLHSIYAAYMDHFQQYGVPWMERSWKIYFATFEEFLSFDWPVITVTDSGTGRPHIVTQAASVGKFIRMIKTRFGETLPMVDNILRVSAFETSQRHVRKVSDATSYKKVHATLPAVFLAALKVRARSGEPKVIRELWDAKDKTFLSIDFEWHERNPSSCLEWGYAAVRCGHLDAAGIWPPDPAPNYGRGHYIISDYVNKVQNKHCPNYPWDYAFGGESQVIPKAKLPQVIQAVMSSHASPDSETVANHLVLVGHGIGNDLCRLEEMKLKIPHNVLVVDTASYERQLYKSGQRGPMDDPTGHPRSPSSTLSLLNILRSLGVDVTCVMHNAGNDAFMGLLALQLLLEPRTRVLAPKQTRNSPGIHAALGSLSATSRSPSGMPNIAFTPSPPVGFPMASRSSSPGSSRLSPRTPDGYFEQDFSSSRRSPSRSPGSPPGHPPRSLNGYTSRRLSVLPPQDGRRDLSSGTASSGVVYAMYGMTISK